MTPAPFDLGGKGKRFTVEQRGQVIGVIRAAGRRRALTEVQRTYGGLTQTTGSFREVLLGSSLGAPVSIGAPGDAEAFRKQEGR